MASLRNKLRRVKVGGQLQDVSEEELAGLSEAAGRAAPPTTPQEAGVIGADPDQAKMAGTPAQQTNALRLGIQGQQRLQDVMRRQQVRRTGTEEEQAQMERGGRLQQLGSLQGRVQSLSEQMVQQAAQTAGAEGATLVLRDDAAQDIPEDQRADFQAKLQQLNQTPGDFQLLKDINNMLGITNVDNMLTADNLTERFLTTQEQSAQITAEAFQDQATVADLDLTELGYEDPAELADLLGMSPEDLQGTNLNQIIREVEAQIEEEHTNTADLQRRAQDPNLGPAERAEARRQLREMGAVGIRAAESDIDQMADQIENADTVTFGGEEIQIGEMLEDEYLSGLTAQYLDPNADDTFKEKLKESEPELVEWIEQNKGILDEAVGEIESGLGDFSELQYRNQAVANTNQGDLSDDIMGQMFDDWDELRTEAYNLKEKPILDILNNEQYPDPSAQANLYQGIQDVQNVSPGLTKEMGQLSEKELRKLGVMAGNKSDKWSQYKDYMKDYTKIANIDPSSPESISEAIMGPGATPEEVQENWQESEIRARSGLFGDSPVGKYGGILDADGDGVVDDAASVAQRLQDSFTRDGQPIGLRDAINQTPDSISADSSKLENYNAQQGAHGVDFNKVKHAFEKDGKFDRRDTIIAAKKMNDTEMEALYDSPISKKMDRRAKNELKNQYDKKYRSKIINDTVGKGDYRDAKNLGKQKWQDVTFEEYQKVEKVIGQLRNRLDGADTLEKHSIKQALKGMGSLKGKWEKKKKWEEEQAEKRRKEEIEKQKRRIRFDLISGAPWALILADQWGVPVDHLLKVSEGEMVKARDRLMRGEVVGTQVHNAIGRQLGKSEGAIGQAARAGGRAASAVKSGAKSLGKAVGGGCFVAGTKFRLANGEVRRVECISPRDELFGGGKTFATACFVGEEMFEYEGICVSGSHAVLENNKWMRVRESQHSLRRPDLDGEYVYVVWNEKHRMISEKGVTFSDYAEVDMPDDSSMRLDELNNKGANSGVA